MLTKKKKIFILVGMVALLVLTGVLNIVLNNRNNNANNTGGGGQQANFFEAYRAKRTSDRAQTIALLDSIISNSASSAKEVEEATAQKLAIAKSSEKELELEALIVATGFTDAVVTNTVENINVIVKANELNENKATQIILLVTENTGSEMETVTVIPLDQE